MPMLKCHLRPRIRYRTLPLEPEDEQPRTIGRRQMKNATPRHPIRKTRSMPVPEIESSCPRCSVSTLSYRSRCDRCVTKIAAVSAQSAVRIEMNARVTVLKRRNKLHFPFCKNG